MAKLSCTRSAKILKGIDAIRKYIDPDNPIGANKVKEFIRMGMPANIIGCVWYAHADNIDEWFKVQTRKDLSNIPDGELDSAE